MSGFFLHNLEFGKKNGQWKLTLTSVKFSEYTEKKHLSSHFLCRNGCSTGLYPVIKYISYSSRLGDEAGHISPH